MEDFGHDHHRAPSWSPAATCARPRTVWAGRPRRSWSGTSSPRSRAMGSRSGARIPWTRHAATASSRASAWAWTCSRASTADAPLVVAEAVWQYSHHVLPGLRRHRGPILTVANWSGEWPGLVGHAQHQRVADQDGPRLQHHLERGPDRRVRRRGDRGRWLETGTIEHDTSHVRDLDRPRCPTRPRRLGRRLAGELADRMAILGVFDEGCMGMYNAIIDDELPQPHRAVSRSGSASPRWSPRCGS